MNEVLRQERKFLINLKDYHRVSHDLRAVMMEDKHNRGDGYNIRSLYFDSIDDRDYEEKEDGVEVRRKIRLRCYGPDQDFAVLEMKQKQGANQKKRSLRVTRADAITLIGGRYSVLLQYPDSFAGECFGVMNMHCYRPKAVVEYKRRAFIAKENNIRVTFDHHIIATEANMNIFDPHLIQYPVMDQEMVVLEVKYNGFLLSYIKNALRTVDGSELSVGKYALSRGISKHYTY